MNDFCSIKTTSYYPRVASYKDKAATAIVILALVTIALSIANYYEGFWNQKNRMPGLLLGSISGSISLLMAASTLWMRSKVHSEASSKEKAIEEKETFLQDQRTPRPGDPPRFLFPQVL